MEKRLWYFPNPAHKTETCEAGPPKWYPDKEPCPPDMSLEDRQALLSESFSEDGDPIGPVRFSCRRHQGELQWFTSRLTLEHKDGRIEVHGFPFRPGKPKIPPRVLRHFRDKGTITKPEYNKLVKT